MRAIRMSGSVILDDQVDAQPLYVSNQTISGQSAPHDVVYVATENNTVYAIDAATGAVLLSRNLGPPVPMSSLPGQCPNNGPNVGINSTPVLSQVDKTIWLVTYTCELNEPLVPSEIEKHPEIALPHPFPLRHPVFRLHALGLETLADNVPPGLDLGDRQSDRRLAIAVRRLGKSSEGGADLRKRLDLCGLRQLLRWRCAIFQGLATPLECTHIGP
ncbi:MAG: PQQ-binding-like beta-propeller repeat protein [Methylocella sp.]